MTSSIFTTSAGTVQFEQVKSVISNLGNGVVIGKQGAILIIDAAGNEKERLAVYEGLL